MTPERKKELKKLAKKISKERDMGLERRLKESNPVPTNHPLWEKYYRAEIARNKELRLNPPNIIPQKKLYRDFIRSDTKPFSLVSNGRYIQCNQCKDAIHTAAGKSVYCSCKGVHLKVLPYDKASYDDLTTENIPRELHILSGEIRYIQLNGRGYQPSLLERVKIFLLQR